MYRAHDCTATAKERETAIHARTRDEPVAFTVLAPAAVPSALTFFVPDPIRSGNVARGDVAERPGTPNAAKI